MNVKHLFCLCIVLLILGCSKIELRKIYLNELQIAKIKMEMTIAEDSCALVDIIEFFPITKKCEQNKQFTSLYVCKEDSTGDTLYVFADCDAERGMPFDKGVCIMGNDIKSEVPKEVVVSMPSNFVIPKKAKYVFSNLLWLVD